MTNASEASQLQRDGYLFQLEVGVLWLGQPLVVCDVYEHAFYVDYQNRKPEYVGKFVLFLDWDEINRRWQALAR